MTLLKRFLVPIIAIVILVPALWPFFRSDFFHLHDWTHVARLAEMDIALRDGHFPVRWSRNLGYGYGMPQFNFYAPLPYYISELFHVAGLSYLWSIKAMVMVNFGVSFIAMYALIKRLWGTQGGLIGATAFIYAPYRAVDTYVRGAFGELTAITLIAVILWSLLAWLKNPSLKLIALTSIAIGGLILSHNLVALLALPLLLVFGILRVVMMRPALKMLWQIILIFGLGIGVAAFYALPALFEKQYTQVDSITTGFSDFHHHFLYLRQFIQLNWGYGGSIFGPDDDISFSLGLASLVAAIAGSGVILIKKRDRWSLSVLGISWLIIFFSIWMSTFKAQLVWEAIPLMKYVQFPWRYLSIIIVFLSLLAGGVALGWKTLPSKIGYVMTAVVVMLIVGWQWHIFKPEAYLDNNETLYYSDPLRIQTGMSSIIPDFLPLGARLHKTEPPATRYDITPPPRMKAVPVDRTHEFLVSTLIDQPSYFTANIFYFPGWTFYVNGDKVPLIVEETGVMSIPLDTPGEVLVSGKFQETPLRAIANGISVVSLLVCGYMLLTLPINSHRKHYA